MTFDSDTLRAKYRQFFADNISVYPDYTAVYTDTAFVQGSTGRAFVYEDEVFSYRLHSFNSVYTAELLPSCELFCSFRNSSDVTSFTHRLRVPCRTSKVAHRTVRSFWIFCSNCSISTRHGRGYLATKFCRGIRSPTLPLNKVLCSELTSDSSFRQ